MISLHCCGVPLHNRLTVEALLLQGCERDVNERIIVAEGDFGLGERGVVG